ncbi:hypothetical protein J2Z22_004824, partial [Paenibacillus forsythiae]
NPVSQEMREKLKKRVASSWSITAVVLRIQEDNSKAPQEYPLVYHYPEKSKLDALNNVPFKRPLKNLAFTKS